MPLWWCSDWEISLTKASSQMCCGTSPIIMACYSINSSSNVPNNSGRSINCQFMVSKDSAVRWTESNEEVLLRSKSTKLQFWRRKSSSGNQFTQFGRLIKKRSGSIKEFVKSFLRNISVFKKLFYFSLGENANSKIDVVSLILQRIFLRFLFLE